MKDTSKTGWRDTADSLLFMLSELASAKLTCMSTDVCALTVPSSARSANFQWPTGLALAGPPAPTLSAVQSSRSTEPRAATAHSRYHQAATGPRAAPAAGDTRAAADVDNVRAHEVPAGGEADYKRPRRWGSLAEKTLDARLQKAEEREASVTNRPPRSRAALPRKLKKFEKFSPHEVVNWIGLMLAHTLSPCKRMDHHWQKDEIGVLPAGTFGRIMARDRFLDF
ncbi:unnamed protein product [Phytophthora lilii]|uniref:Unnamed protein product n=1 Tax=Phytophthora lilii TaxID=2077276 RepID=A0A9W7CPK5_9STRA|nr:unnamed protein product [Phytophthora lilii]